MRKTWCLFAICIYLGITYVNSQEISFGVDSFGNYICFNKSDGAVVFLDFESGEIEMTTDGFSEFLKIIDPQYLK
jgi:hypothetical protein